jgi:hypothetical protein
MTAAINVRDITEGRSRLANSGPSATSRMQIDEEGDRSMRKLLSGVVLATMLLSAHSMLAAELPVARPMFHAVAGDGGAGVLLVRGGGMGGRSDGGMGSGGETGGMSGGATASGGGMSSGSGGGMSNSGGTGGMNGAPTANGGASGANSNSSAKPAQASECSQSWTHALWPFHRAKCPPVTAHK